MNGSSKVTNQSVPIVLPVSTEDKSRLEGMSAITLSFNGQPVAIMRKPQFYAHRKEERCCRQFGTNNLGHPYIKVKTNHLNFKKSIHLENFQKS